MTLPPFPNYPYLPGEKVTLRKIELEDLKDLVEITYYDAVQATSLEEAITMQAKIDQDYLEGNSVHWGIEDNQSKKIIGSCGYHSGFKDNAGELGCVLMKQYQGQGFMHAALEMAIDFGIHKMKLKRICAITTQDNKKAIQLLERLP